MKLEMFQNDKIWQNMHIIHFFLINITLKRSKHFFFAEDPDLASRG